MILRLMTIVAALCLPAAGLAQPAYNETGWRPATGEEKALRQAFESGKNTWSKSDGQQEMYDCMFLWTVVANSSRKAQDDSFPMISGELSHAFAEGQLSHYANALYVAEGEDYQKFATGVLGAAERAAQSNLSNEAYFRALGKCYVHPASWSFAAGVTFTGPLFSRNVLQQDVPDAYPIYVKNPTARRQFDELILGKDFAGAANFATRLINSGDKTTVYWHEVLDASALAASTGRGAQLDEGLLKVLGDVWWPKYRRQWAKNLLRIKRGEPDPNRAKLHDPGKEPAWSKLEYERYRAGRTNYVPCNTWRRDGCD